MLNRSKVLTAMLSLAALFMLSAFGSCGKDVIEQGKFTAGGTIPNDDSNNGMSTFTTHGDNCDPGAVNFGVNYVGHDGVTLNSVELIDNDLDDMGQCVKANRGGDVSDLCKECLDKLEDLNRDRDFGFDEDNCPEGPVYAAEFTYVSKSQDSKGETGRAIICVQDNGEGANAEYPDLGLIYVKSGPFAEGQYRRHHYMQGGALQGNVQSHSCDSVD